MRSLTAKGLLAASLLGLGLTIAQSIEPFGVTHASRAFAQGWHRNLILPVVADHRRKRSHATARLASGVLQLNCTTTGDVTDNR